MMNSIISKVKITNSNLNKLIMKNKYVTKKVYEVVEIHPPVCPVCNKVVKFRGVCELGRAITSCPVI